MQFADRTDAGRRLAARLQGEDLVDPVVLALPRGGVIVGAEVAAGLALPLHAFVARKIGAPSNPEVGIGAVAEGSDDVVISPYRRGLSEDEVRSLARDVFAEVGRRAARYREGRPAPSVTGRDVLLVDDGLATGVTALAAMRSLRLGRPRRLLLAAPVGSRSAVADLAVEADAVVCLHVPHAFFAVGNHYAQFDQSTDDEVMTALHRGSRTQPPSRS